MCENVLFLNFNYIKLKISIKSWFLKRHFDLNAKIIFQKYLCQPRPLARMVALMLLGVTTAFNIPIHPFPPTNVDSNNFESIIFILQNPQKDIRIKIYLSIFSLITETTSTNPSQFPYPPLSRHCYNQWWGRPKRMQNDSKGNYRKRLCETRRRKCYCHLMSTSKLRGETRPPVLNTN